VGAHFLVIDDLADNLRLVSRCLHKHIPGCEIHTAQHGEEGLAIARRQPLDVILIDAHMPGIDGFELCRRLKRDPTTSRLPVLMISAVRVKPKDRVTGLENGADGYLCKPYEVAELIAQVKALLRIKRNEDALHRRAQEAIKGTERKYQRLVDTVQEGIWVVDETDRTTFVNPCLAQMLGYDAEEMRGRPLSSFLDPSDVRRCKQGLLQERNDNAQPLDFELRKKDGHRIFTTIKASPIRDTNGRYKGFIAGVHNITERKQLERAVLETSERERLRIGQDLHDGLRQYLAGVGFQLKTLEKSLSERRAPEASEVSDIIARLDEAVAQARNIARGLYPVELAERGLVAALRELASGIEKVYHITSIVRNQGDDIRDEALAGHLYRITQEATNNAIRHGRATRIVIELLVNRTRTLLKIVDNGIGVTATSRDEMGMGLHLMEFRAQQMGGTLEVRRAPDRGTVVSCSIP